VSHSHRTTEPTSHDAGGLPVLWRDSSPDQAWGVALGPAPQRNACAPTPTPWATVHGVVFLTMTPVMRNVGSNIQMPRMACGCEELPRGRLIWAEPCHDRQVPAIRAAIKETLRMQDSRDTFSYSGILQKVDLKQMAVVILARRGP
jgi:hypothetical protein